MTIQIHGDLGSGSFRRVATAAKIMGVDIEHINVDLFKGESHTPAFLKLNPHGLTPVLQDGDTIIWEASAINIYLAEKAGSALLGKSANDRYQVLQWMFWSGEQWRVFATLLFNERVAGRVMGQAEDPSIVNLLLKNMRAAASVLDAHLASRRFIVGDELTLADIDIAAPFSQVFRTKAPFVEFPNLWAWQERLLETVPAWADTRRDLDDRMDTFLSANGVTF
ncbi:MULTISPECIES: glutathione S-transferase family protein [Massilia]|uniref:Glutathione S-transferase n=1 Tax=Massilia aurea TaxID=373040 RepID=A0A422QPC5_9BURK|nr:MULTISPECIES: glutathione S-transferase family protein [Massilia]MDY0965394.1 glutathione S-transferase family protein [Massilia sp. CFBP9026]RNF31859.1 glutathione S-transferase [Massilia aurea]